MSSREIAASILDSLSDDQIQAFITLFSSESVRAMMEAERIAAEPDRKRYSDFGEIEKEIFADEEVSA